MAAFIQIRFNDRLFEHNIAGTIRILTTRVERMPDLSTHPTHPRLADTGEPQPECLLLIIGESLSRTHMSLYGYEYPTTPRLEARAAGGRLIPFTAASSPATVTVPSFKQMMTRNSLANPDSVPWYDCTTIPELARAAGYTSDWISNQSHYGRHDSGVGIFADICDHNKFIGNEYVGIYRYTYDGDLLAPLDSTIAAPSAKPRLIIVHLMGSHAAFHFRYPGAEAHFKGDDYPALPPESAVTMAHYDNSVLYNDKVVDAMFDKIEGLDAIAVYLSDHALDVFDADNTFSGNGRATIPASMAAAHRIPLMFYVTRRYAARRPETVRRLRRGAANPVNTDNLIYTIASLMGRRFADSAPDSPAAASERNTSGKN